MHIMHICTYKSHIYAYLENAYIYAYLVLHICAYFVHIYAYGIYVHIFFFAYFVHHDIYAYYAHILKYYIIYINMQRICSYM